MVPNRFFLDKAFYVTSKYYTGLVYGPLFQLWGIWIVIISLYCILVLYLVYRQARKSADSQSVRPVITLLVITCIWLATGIGDDLTGIQVIDLPPLAWIGAFLITCAIAWILILQIDTLYKERMDLNKRLIRDHLTGTYSRSFFELRVRQTVDSLRRGEMSSICLCIFDIDDFKQINDRFGHSAGDAALQAIGKAVTACVRSTDCAARLGGDEFAVLLPGIPRDPVAVQIIGRVRDAISQLSFTSVSETFRVTCSFGISRIDARHIDHHELIKDLMVSADEALYEAKRSGKNQVSTKSLVPRQVCDEE
jgi:diguanylate cyclase (GGDEF)-like protein